MIKPEILDNNLRAIVHPLKGTEAVTTLVLIGAGSRYETEQERGISHFLEHMFFKGGEHYKNAREVASAIDSVGGDFNAFTGKEYTGYYVKTAKNSIDTAFSVLSDMLLSAKLEQNEIEKERGVILEEYNLYQDTPIYQIGWDFEHLLFGDQPLGWDQIGTKENIKRFNREDFVNYKNDCYTASNTLIIVAGNITKEEGIKKINEYFNFKSDKPARKHNGLIKNINQQKFSLKDKKTEQGHLVMGYPGVPFGSDEDFIARIMAVIMGGNMSSRMFSEIREKRGLCYSISTSTDHFADTGVISTHAGVDLMRFESAIEAIKTEYEKATEKGFTEKELKRAKSFLTGKLTLKMEDSEEIASFLSTQIILTNKAKSLDQIFKEINEISLSDINNLSKKLFNPQKLALAVIGPFADKEEKLRKIIEN